MVSRVERTLLRLASRKKVASVPGPLLSELLGKPLEGAFTSYESYPFAYQLATRSEANFYNVSCTLPNEALISLRRATAEVSERLDPVSVQPLTFDRLVSVLTQMAAEWVAQLLPGCQVRELAELVAYEAIGLSRILAIAKDAKVTEFFVDSDSSPLYLDHVDAGRCETTMLLVGRERQSLETHMDTFNGYTIDYDTPSLKNDLEIAGARLRISLDLDPISVNRFSLDVRRLSVTSLSIRDLAALGVISVEAASTLIGWVESGGNVTIVGETGTGKTTLLNAIDEQVQPKLRRIYIEDAVETGDLIGRGYHQVKLKVDPFDRGTPSERTKESEIVKALHRSPDIVILSELQSESHSKAFFHALSAGVRGIQTFHASTVEQALRRWVEIHGIPRQCLLDLGLLVQMVRPDRLRSGRFVARICEVMSESGEPRLRDVFVRDREFRLQRVGGVGWLRPPIGVNELELASRIASAEARLGE